MTAHVSNHKCPMVLQECWMHGTSRYHHAKQDFSYVFVVRGTSAHLCELVV